MIIDIKYHIASLVAVFLALAIGILVGTSIIGNDGMSQRQQQIITALEQDFAHLRKDNAKQQEEIKILNAEIQQSQRFEKTILPSLVAGRLVGRDIAVIETGNNYMTKEMADLIKLAGGNIRSYTSISPKLANANELNQDQLAGVLDQDVEDKTLLPKMLSNKIGKEIVAAEHTGFLASLAELDLIEMEGDYSNPVETVVVIGGSEKEDNEKIEAIDIPLIHELQQNDVRIIGAEFSNDGYSYMRYYQKQDITTIDHLDTVPGQLTLVLALQGKKGNFGNKKTAEKLIPELEW